jgi:hypothetical protein
MYKKPIKENSPPSICQMHRREIEALCVECKSLVCASCTLTLNSDHKAHSFMPLHEACKHVRSLIDQSLKFNVLKREYTQERLMSIKQTRLEVELKTQELMAKIEGVVQNIIMTLNQRKNEIFEYLQSKVEKESEVLRMQENIWKEKEKIQNKIIEVGHNPDDNYLISNASFILKGLDHLKEKINLNSTKVHGDFDMNLKIIKNKEGVAGMASLKNTSKSQLQNSGFFQRMANKSSAKKPVVNNLNVFDPNEKIDQNIDNQQNDEDLSDKEITTFHLEELLETINNMFKFGEPFIIEYRS